jgi:flagellar capping protein FliD
MDIAILSATAAASLGNSRTKAQSSVDPITQAFQNADKRVQLQRESVSVQLSSFGRLKSSFSETQTASRALSDTKQPVTDADLTKTTNNFIKAFNTAAQTARSVAIPKGALTDNSRARAAENDLSRTISADSTATSDLKKIGVTQQQDGTLAIDQNKFNAALKTNPDAVRSTLSAIGQQVDRTATRELANSGNIGSSVSSLDNRAKKLENQQAEQQALAVASWQTTSAQTSNPNNSLSSQNTGAAAYLRIFSI